MGSIGQIGPITHHQETSMIERIFNFSAGPAVLPVPVLEEAQREIGRAHV